MPWGNVHEKIMIEAMSIVQFVSKVSRVSNKTENNDWARASVCLLVASALDKVHL